MRKKFLKAKITRLEKSLAKLEAELTAVQETVFTVKWNKYTVSEMTVAQYRALYHCKGRDPSHIVIDNLEQFFGSPELKIIGQAILNGKPK